MIIKQVTGSWKYFTGQAQGKRTRAAQKEGKRRTGNGEGATKNSKKGGSYFFSSITGGDNQRSSGIDLFFVAALRKLFSKSVVINLTVSPNLKGLECM